MGGAVDDLSFNFRYITNHTSSSIIVKILDNLTSINT